MSDQDNKPAEPALFSVNTLKAEAEKRIRALWAGEVALFNAFWVYGFAVVAGLSIIASPFDLLGSLIHLVALGWSLFMIKPIWLAADKYQGPQHWAVAAKIAVVLGGLSTLASLLG
ncbi:MAG: hypothetical protein HYS17_03870 [Micavibrio aeruginosavorus]|uniref:Uncharacterized protein n=1 Tax=Micavibrio aeruginosavorus TaxID=349221 RepID=A0A7T5UH46_9BACT|nr:MAG: hypothetical protein HYS17_03870 [Micavibrio aeruginosavorus]